MSGIIKELLNELNEDVQDKDEAQTKPAMEDEPAGDNAGDNTTDIKDDVNPDEVKLDAADESAIFLAALEASCTPEEFDRIVKEHATELELYQLIDSASVATEARRYLVTKSRQWDLNREEKKAAIRLAAKADTTDYRQYIYHRKKMITYRTKIYEKFGAKARSIARQIIQNSRRRASSMNSPVGKSIVDKMDKRIEEAKKRESVENNNKNNK